MSEAKSEFSVQFEIKSCLKKGGSWIVPVHFVKQISSDLNISKMEIQKRGKEKIMVYNNLPK